ncbi:RING-H2 finger protein ATL3 [Capsicum chacoense]
MADASSYTPGKLDDPSMVELTAKVLVVAVTVLFLVVFFIFSLHLYSKWFWNRHRQADGGNPNTTRRRRRFEFSPGHQEVHVTSVLSSGLDPSLLKTIPVVLFNPEEFKDGLECAVCLCDVSEGEKARLLPKCNHGFHVECIDMWFQSHSTCPLCRNPVVSEESTVENILRTSVDEEEPATVDMPNFPTNVLFWGNETQVSTLGSSLEESSPSPPPPPSSSSLLASTSDRQCASLVIDIPRETNEVVVEEEHKSPMPTRLRSLKRLLSRDRKANPSSPRIDVEQGDGVHS